MCLRHLKYLKRNPVLQEITSEKKKKHLTIIRIPCLLYRVYFQGRLGLSFTCLPLDTTFEIYLSEEPLSYSVLFPHQKQKFCIVTKRVIRVMFQNSMIC